MRSPLAAATIAFAALVSFPAPVLAADDARPALKLQSPADALPRPTDEALRSAMTTLRDTVGLGGDFGLAYAADPGGFYRTSRNSWMFGVANSVDLRAAIDFRYYETGSAFEYDTIRFLYMRQRLLEDEKLRGEGADLPRSTGVPAGQ